MDAETIRKRIARYRRAEIDDATAARAAVVLLLDPNRAEPHVLLIQRAVRERDPWSGHVAFPGGRKDPQDTSLVETAQRETREEVGIDLARAGELVGGLDDLSAVIRTRPIDLVISPFVYLLHEPVEPTLNPREVESIAWVPLSHFVSPTSQAVYRRVLEGTEQEFPAYQWEHYTVWGLTHRILDRFFRVIRDEE